MTSKAADQAHQHNVIVTSAPECLLALDTFLHEAKSAIERQRPLIERGDPQIKLVKIERLESITGDQAECLLGKPPAMSVALSDQDAELGIAREPIDIVEVDEADACAVGFVFYRKHNARTRLILEHGVDPIGLHCLGNREAVAEDAVAGLRIVAPAH